MINVKIFNKYTCIQLYVLTTTCDQHNAEDYKFEKNNNKTLRT